jgi:hypothetical protein
MYRYNGIRSGDGNGNLKLLVTDIYKGEATLRASLCIDKMFCAIYIKHIHDPIIWRSYFTSEVTDRIFTKFGIGDV